MNEHRLRQAIDSVERTRSEFDELAERAGEIDAQLADLPEPPKLARPLLGLLVLAVVVFAGLIGVLAYLSRA